MNWTKLNSYAYSPYSEQPKCCIVKGKSGLLYPGVIIENISYPLTITAEQAAFSSCLSEGDAPTELLYPDKPSVNPQFWLEEFSVKVTVNNEFPGGMIFNPLKSLTGNIKTDLSNLKDRAVTPNSGFPVSALLHVSDGNLIEGVNVEFSAWVMGLCAERVAIARALSAGYRQFEKLSIHVPKSDFASPCGACRQVISEWMDYQFIDLYHGNGTLSVYQAKDFLPYALKTYSLKKAADSRK